LYFRNQNNKIVQTLKAIFTPEGANILDVRIIDNDAKRYEIPKGFYKESQPFNGTEEKLEYKWEIGVKDKGLFDFKIIRKATNEVIFDTSIKNFIYSNNYLEFGSSLPTNRIYGLGERNNPSFLMGPGTYTLLARDQVGVIENGSPGHNVYGSHPMYLVRELNQLFHIVFFQNSNAMDVIIEDRAILYKTVLFFHSSFI